jgi:hypothetical protein
MGNLERGKGMIEEGNDVGANLCVCPQDDEKKGRQIKRGRGQTHRFARTTR